MSTATVKKNLRRLVNKFRFAITLECVYQIFECREKEHKYRFLPKQTVNTIFLQIQTHFVLNFQIWMDEGNFRQSVLIVKDFFSKNSEEFA